MHVDFSLVSFKVQSTVHASKCCATEPHPESHIRICFHSRFDLIQACSSFVFLQSCLHLFYCCLYSFFISYMVLETILPISILLWITLFIF